MTDGIRDTFAAGYDRSEVTQVVHLSKKIRLLAPMELLADISMEVADAAPSEISIYALSSPPSEAISSASPFEVAKNRIRRALKEFSENSKLMERSPCCGRTGYTGPTGRTGPRHDPPDPSAYSTHTALPRLAS